MNTNFSLLFYLKKPKTYVSGPVPIYMRITVNGDRKEISTSRDIMPDRWNQSAGRGTGTKEEIKTLNMYLDTLQVRMFEAHRQLLLSEKVITTEMLKNKFTGHTDKPRMITPIFQQQIKEMIALIGKDYAPATIKKYETTLGHLSAFIKDKFNLSDIDIREINHAFVKDLEFFLKTTQNCGHNVTMKYLTIFKKIVRICMANNWIQGNPFAIIKMGMHEVETIYLTEEELQALQQKEFRIERLAQVRDVFVFCCYTGLAYVDVSKLSKDHISMGIDGHKWIYINRTKTETPSRIPLLPMAEAILSKYSDHPQVLNTGRLLPVSSNQKMNAYLKEVADLAGIAKELTTHAARHTFATTVTLTNDVPLETVSKMLGHKSIKQTQHYAKVVDKKISRDMGSLREKFKADEKKIQLSVTG